MATNNQHVAEAGSHFYKCQACGIFFATLEAAKKHTCAKTSENQTTEDVDVEQTMFTCEECSGWFMNKKDFMAHPCEQQRITNTAESELSNSQGNLPLSNPAPGWNKPATLMLIAEYSNLKERQESGFMRKKTMWEKICKKLSEEGYHFSVDQISGRWKSLMRGYRNVKDHNSKSGNSHKTFEYEHELDELFETDPTIQPEATMSSAAPKRSLSLIGSELDVSTSSENSTPAKKKITKSSSSKEIVETFKSYIEDQKKREKEEWEKREKMHQEKINVMQSLVAAISGSQDDH